ncbi:hypothetical protein XI01_02340 [Bradyrhizobium sp. CCBAU 21360]|nr:hypothetical protein [Bradyrhizobium sp. CCBAU 21360]
MSAAAVSPSVTDFESDETVAASLLPVMVTVTVPVAVPSWLVTVNWSCTCWPAVSSSWAPLPV